MIINRRSQLQDLVCTEQHCGSQLFKRVNNFNFCMNGNLIDITDSSLGIFMESRLSWKTRTDLYLLNLEELHII